MLTPRQSEIAVLVAKGLSDKAIARATGLSRRTVEDHVSEAASRLPGNGRPRFKLICFFSIHQDEADAAA